MEKPKENILIFTSPVIKEPKRWISGFMALIFFFGSISSALANRGGNYGEYSSEDMFAVGAITGAITDISITMAGYSAGPWGAAAVGAGAAASDLTSTYIYYNNYHSSGETMELFGQKLEFEIFNTKVKISKQAFWSMVAATVVSIGVGWVSGAGATEKEMPELAAEQAGRTIVETTIRGTVMVLMTLPERIVARIIELIRALIEKFIKMVITKFGEEFAVQKLHWKRMWAQTIGAIVNLIAGLLNSLFHNNKEVVEVEDEDGNISYWDEKNDTDYEGEITTEVKDGKIVTTLKTSDGDEYTVCNVKGTDNKVLIQTKEGNMAVVAAKNILAMAVFFTTGIGVDAVLDKCFGVFLSWFMGSEMLFGAGGYAVSGGDVRNETYLRDKEIWAHNKKTVVSGATNKNNASYKLDVDTEFKYDPKLIKSSGTEQSSAPVVDGKNTEQGLGVDTNFKYNNSSSVNPHLEHSPLTGIDPEKYINTPFTLLDLINGKVKILDPETGKIIYMPVMEFHQKAEYNSQTKTYILDGKEVIPISINGYSTIDPSVILNALGEIDLKLMREVMDRGLREGLPARDPQGRIIQKLPLGDAILGELSAEGYAGAFKSVALNLISEALGYEEYRGSNKKKAHKQNIRVIIAQGMANILADLAMNWDAFGSRYAGTVNSNPWRSQPNDKDYTYGKYLAKLSAHELGVTLAKLAFTQIHRHRKMHPVLQGAVNLALNSLVSVGIDALFRQDTGRVEMTEIELYKVAGNKTNDTAETRTTIASQELIDKNESKGGKNRKLTAEEKEKEKLNPDSHYIKLVDKGGKASIYEVKERVVLIELSQIKNEESLLIYIKGKEQGKKEIVNRNKVPANDGSFIEIRGDKIKEDPWLASRLEWNLKSAGRVLSAMPKNYNDYIIQVSNSSIPRYSPYSSSGIGLDTEAVWDANQDRWIGDMGLAIQGMSPEQILGMHISQNLTQYAAADFGNSFGYALANNWIPEEYRQYAAFISDSERIAQEKERKEKELSRVQNNIKEAKDLQSKVDKLNNKIAGLKELEGDIVNSSLYNDQKDILEPELKRLRGEIAQKENELIDLTSTSRGVPQSVVAEIIKIAGKSIWRDSQKASEAVRVNLPKAIGSLEQKEAGIKKELGLLKNAKALNTALAGVPLLGGLTIAATGGPRGGVIDYTVNRRIDISPEMGDHTKKTIEEVVKETGKDQPVDEAKRKLFLESQKTAQVWQLVSSYSPSVAGVPLSIENYENLPILSVAEPFFTSVRREEKQETLVVGKGNISKETASKYNEFGKELARLYKELFAAEKTDDKQKSGKIKEEISKLREEIQSTSDSFGSQEKEETARNIVNISMQRELDPGRKLVTYIEGIDDPSHKDKVKGTLQDIREGRKLYHENNSLTSIITRDRFGRQKETSYYTQENTGSGWQNIKEDRATEHFYGPFGHELSVTKDYTQVNLPKEWPKTVEITEIKRQEPTTETVNTIVPGKTKEWVKMPDLKEVKEPREKARKDDWSLGIYTREELEDRFALPEYSAVIEDLKKIVPAWWSKHGYNKNNAFNKMTLRGYQILAMITDNPENMKKWEAMSPEAKEEYVGRLENYFSVWDRENTDTKSNPGVRNNMNFKNNLPELTFKEPGKPSRNVVWNFSNVAIPLIEVTGPSTIRQEIRHGTKEVTEKITKETPLPFSTGSNTSYDLSFYSIGEGSSPYTGPSYRLSAADINSGPALNTQNYYQLGPDQAERELHRQSVGVFEKVLRQELGLPKGNSGISAGPVTEKEVEDMRNEIKKRGLKEEFERFIYDRNKDEAKMSIEDYFKQRIAGPVKYIIEFNPNKDEAKMSGEDYFKQWIAGLRYIIESDPNKDEAKMSREDYFKQWIAGLRYIIESDPTVRKITNDGKEIDQQAKQRLSSLQEVRAYKYTEISGREDYPLISGRDYPLISGREDYPLPLWAIRRGYGLGDNLKEAPRFTRIQENIYDSDRITSTIKKYKDIASSKDNMTFRDFLDSVSVQDIGDKAFVIDKLLSGSYSNFGKYQTIIGSRVSKYGFTLDPGFPIEYIKTGINQEEGAITGARNQAMVETLKMISPAD